MRALPNCILCSVCGRSASRSVAARSSPEDWQDRGQVFWAAKQWEHAEKCFLRANERARAFEAGARRLVTSANNETRPAEKVALLKAAATACLYAGREFGAAAADEQRKAQVMAARVYVLAAQAARKAADATSVQELFLSASSILERCGLPHPVVGVVACIVEACSDAPRISRHLWGRAAAFQAQADCPSGFEPADWEEAARLLTLLESTAETVTEDELASAVVKLQSLLEGW